MSEDVTRAAGPRYAIAALNHEPTQRQAATLERAIRTNINTLLSSPVDSTQARTALRTLTRFGEIYDKYRTARLQLFNQVKASHPKNFATLVPKMPAPQSHSSRFWTAWKTVKPLNKNFGIGQQLENMRFRSPKKSPSL